MVRRVQASTKRLSIVWVWSGYWSLCRVRVCRSCTIKELYPHLWGKLSTQQCSSLLPFLLWYYWAAPLVLDPDSPSWSTTLHHFLRPHVSHKRWNVTVTKSTSRSTGTIGSMHAFILSVHTVNTTRFCQVRAHEKDPEAGWHPEQGPFKPGHDLWLWFVRNMSEDLGLCVHSD